MVKEIKAAVPSKITKKENGSSNKNVGAAPIGKQEQL